MPRSRAKSASDTSPDSLVERELLARAYQKVLRKEPLTNPEQAALKRHEKAREETLRWQYYRSIPQKHWREMSGRQAKVLNEQALLYGLPFGSATIDLSQVVRRLHDLLAAHGRELLTEDSDPLLSRGHSPALEQYRQERARLAQLDRLEREEELVSVVAVQAFLSRLAQLLRTAGMQLQTQCGPVAHQLWESVFDQLEREIELANWPLLTDDEIRAAATGTSTQGTEPTSPDAFVGVG
jgi:hypothetical protein